MAQFNFFMLFPLLSVVAGLAIEKRGACPMHYKTGPNNLCFRFAEDRKNWQDAKRQCESEGAILANSQSDQVYQFLKQNIESNPTRASVHAVILPFIGRIWKTNWNNGWWIGASRSGSFKWLDGQPVRGHWLPSMPDNFGGKESCLQQMDRNDGWNDYPCHVGLRFICQKTADPCGGVHCGNGRCVANGGRASCVCNNGWTGSACGVVVDPCHSMDCGNGRCVSNRMIGGSGRCACSTGWTGPGCNVVVDPCNGVDCGHGKCVADRSIGGSARCICLAGWMGSRCSVVDDPCNGVNCGNGKCVSDKSIGGSAKCICDAGFSGDKCQKACRFAVTRDGFPAKMDAMILFDGSNSLRDGGGDEARPDFFKMSLKFIQDIADKMEIGPEKARLELVQFSHKSREELDFASSAAMGGAALKKKIDAIGYLTGGTFTGKALEYAFSIFQTHGRKGSDIAKYLFVITDGDSRQAKQIEKAIGKIKGLGIDVIAIGVGSGVHSEELRLIAGGNLAKVFSVSSFEQLDQALISRMVENICD